ncbi:MAG: alpha/beta hydrolase family protein [Candidatus Limnocylindria bacterium]
MSTNPSTAAADQYRFGFSDEMPTVTVVSTETVDGVTVTDLTFGAATVESTEAYLVAPASGEPGPGIIWFHWYERGNPTSSRTQFLEEARALAASGVTSFLVQGAFPREDDPDSIAHDMPAIEAEVRMLRTGLNFFATRPEVNPEHFAVVGHDFGGMYQSILFGADHHLDGLVLMAPTARWADWFYRYWAISDSEADYLAAMAPLDPVTWLPEVDGRPVLLQFASNDQYVPEAVADEITQAAGPTAEARTYTADHHLNEEARADRDAWLAETLGFPAPE